jgi:hypothetical protein
MTTQITLEPHAVIEAAEGNVPVVAFNVGPDLRPYAVIAHKPLDYRRADLSGANFAKVTPESPQSYRVVCVDGSRTALDVTFGHVSLNVHEVQPLDDAILLVCSRSYCRGPDDFDLNAQVFDYGGRLLRSFLLGDGIASVQTTADGTIWASYFDEGVFGNFGWREPVGASGLVAWSRQGGRLYEFAPPAGADSIVDCYAMNVVSDAVTWCYYYTEFLLVRVCNRRAEAYWPVPISGSQAFAISDNFVLIGGGYRERDIYTLFQLQDGGKLRACCRFQLCIATGTAPEKVIGRGDAIWLLCDGSIYRFGIADALAISGIRP